MAGVVAVGTGQRRVPTYMTLAQDDTGPVLAADWIGKFVMLGRMAARWSREHPETQLVVALSVPIRDFAAVLTGCGWMSAAAAPSIRPVREVIATMPIHAPARVVTPNKVLTERFGGINVDKDRARFGSEWQIDKLRALVPLDSLEVPRTQSAPEPGVISRLTGLDSGWAARLCAPPKDLALIGTLKWLREDLTAFLGIGYERERIANLLLPEYPRAATWSTQLWAASQLEEEPPPSEVRAVVLDGAAATKHLPAIESDVVISILDRSVVDESASERVMNYRNTRGEPVPLERELNWKPPAGVEALGFAVPL
ncbi:hypothetical protein [Saccharopolyspora gregorii]|uniref:hypothetical protein n=1 Tax=Saccharopolyspora gregorii TaxID=33914 RepID=UPI0021ABF101|nr:hypothetical protein [Saccharopolyspora gregorii]